MIRKITVLFVILICAPIFAQKSDSSPYSALGIGGDIPAKTVEEMSMGGVGTASTEYQLSFSNPATYSLLNLTSYTLAGENKSYSLNDGINKEKVSNTRLSYLAVGIPLGIKGGFGFGIQPSTSVGYRLVNNVLDSDDVVSEVTIFEGNGGTNRLFLGGGYEVFKGIRVGIEGQFVFGQIENSVVNQDRDIQLGTKFEADGNVKGFGFETGVLYTKELKKDLFLNLGATINYESKLDLEGNEYIYSFSSTGISKDTILDKESKGSFTTPLKTSLGVSIGDPKKWSANIDYSFRDAIKLEGSFVNKNPNLRYQSANQLSIGGFYIPKFNSISSYWDRVVYRAGIRVEQTGIMVNGNQNTSDFTALDDFGISFGVGLPMANQISRLNLGFEFGKRGNTDVGLIEESYFNFRLGLSLSNKWFRKREIN